MSSTVPPNRPDVGSGGFLHKAHRLRQPKGNSSKRVKVLEWQTQTLTQVLELQTSLANSSSFEHGVQLVASWLKETLDCDDVSISVFATKRVELKAIASRRAVNTRLDVRMPTRKRN